VLPPGKGSGANDRYFVRREFEAEGVLLEDRLVAPASRPVELGDHRRAFVQADLINAVLEAVECEQSTIDGIAGRLQCIQHGFGRQARIRLRTCRCRRAQRGQFGLLIGHRGQVQCSSKRVADLEFTIGNPYPNRFFAARAAAVTYQVKEIFYTLQGEGLNAGRAAVFCRFSGCNLWSGREADRAVAQCSFCDTDFVGTDGTLGGRYDDAAALAEAIAACWTGSDGRRLVVLTGGEPLLQVDAALIDALHARSFEIAVETNGTIAAPPGLDWICVSPKAGNPVVQRSGHELKVVVPQPSLDLLAMASWDFRHFLVQPMDNVLAADNRRWAIDWCMQHPRWRLSVQTHKAVGIR
jgi:7-carboxy-7-deazaguanine synthase